MVYTTGSVWRLLNYHGVYYRQCGRFLNYHGVYYRQCVASFNHIEINLNTRINRNILRYNLLRKTAITTFYFLAEEESVCKRKKIGNCK